MWTEAHRARHEARLKDMVTVSTVGAVGRWPEQADPPRSPRAPRCTGLSQLNRAGFPGGRFV
jgi:hypothetical protein